MRITVNVVVTANDVMEAEMMRTGIQNILDELGQYQQILVELADPVMANEYKEKLMKIINNPIVKKLANVF